jgi:hypothetical protein
MRTLYIMQSASYTSYGSDPPTRENIDFVKAGSMRVLKVKGNAVYGLRRDETWKHIPHGNALRQVLHNFCPLVKEQQE